MARRKKVVEEELVTTEEAVEDRDPVAQGNDEPELVTTGEAVEDRDPVTYADDGHSAETTPPLIAVSVVIVAGDRYVLEWRDPAGNLRRAWANAAVAEATEDALNALESYEDDALLAIVEDVSWSQARVVAELHRMGVWRVQDINANVLNSLYQGLARKAAGEAGKRMVEVKASLKH